jgi:putative NIF3 family GTP cyclohydrolase 1 type 2
MQALALTELVDFLDEFFAVDPFQSDPHGIYHPSDRPIRRLGMALEPWEGISAWVITHRVDALFLHRPWRLQADQLMIDIGVVFYHLPFDERLTLGFNPELADTLNMTDLEVLGCKEGRAIGMIGNVPAQSFTAYSDRVTTIFGGREAVCLPDQAEVSRVAVIGAMTDALVREAAAQGAQVYLTGQLRKPAALAVVETRIGAIAVGHRRSENWGLRALAGLLQERWAGLEVIFP